MFFNSLSFVFGFLPITIILFYLLCKISDRGGAKFICQLFLTCASLLFYALLTPEYLPLLLISILFNFSIGKSLIVSQKDHQKWLKPILFCGIAGDLLLLGYYKYFNFAIVNLDAIGFSIPMQEIVLPLGISFFTFTQIAFLADTYHGKVEEVNPISYLQFVTFFPHLIAGPIYHHADIIHQFEDHDNYKVNWDNINLGIFFFFMGLAKKVIIADSLATIATPFFSAVAAGGTPMFFEAWFGALAYSLQLYFDFSGYSDMAIGIALMFNIHFPVNFFSPYKVTSIIDFWRCWHITLSNWLRDYLYIPLGGSWYGFPAQLRNLLITMLLGGLWHGAGWTFIIWGGLHGLYLCINHLWRKTGIKLHVGFCWFVTFVAVVIGWVFFRADSVMSAIVILKGMAGINGISISAGLPHLPFAVNDGLETMNSLGGMIGYLSIIISFLIAMLLPNLSEITRNYSVVLASKKQFQVELFKPINIPINYRLSLIWTLFTVIVAVCAIISIQTTSEFLYFQF